MKLAQSRWAALLLLPLLFLGAGARAQDAAPKPQAQYSEKGADTCISCHGPDEVGSTTFAIFKTKHASRTDAHSPFGPGGLQCEACHGPGAAHSAKGSKKKLTINSFKPSSFMTAQERNAPCISCHQGGERMAWHASAHEDANVACADCHKVHAPRDPALAKSTEAGVCFACHKQQLADAHKPSSHPFRSGEMACSGCHAPHGSGAASLLTKATINQTCTGCHAEKRGPFLWEHAPVAEDCSLCHTPHGSVRPALLTKSPPLLCQQCHSVQGHPAVAYTGSALPGKGQVASVFVLANGCTNCHSQVHGSNHPSGNKLMR